MPVSIPCPECSNNIPQPAERCPHCGKPGIFWNVQAAQDATEQAALEQRYQSAKNAAIAQGSNLPLQDFEVAVAKSRAVIARSLSDVLRLVTSDKQLYATYYQMREAGLRLPEGSKWDVLREIADTLLFPGYKQEIRFAALSLDGIGLSNYGECSIVLRDEMIAHRASVFEENSVIFMKRHNVDVWGWEPGKLPKGYRATWDERAKLTAAKLAEKIDAGTTSDQYSAILLRQGATSEEDEFVEVHIWGPMTALTIERIIVTAPKPRQRATIIKAIKAKAAKAKVSVS
jgi:hypothetical protein